MNDIRNGDDVTALLSAPVDADTLSQLHRRLKREAEQADLVETLSEKLSPRILRAPKRLDEVARVIDEHFAKHRQVFDLTDGTLGGYIGGLEAKTALLSLEAAA